MIAINFHLLTLIANIRAKAMLHHYTGFVEVFVHIFIVFFMLLPYIYHMGSQEGAISDAEVSLCDLIADYQAIEEKQSNDWSKLSAGLNKNGEISPFVQLFPAF